MCDKNLFDKNELGSIMYVAIYNIKITNCILSNVILSKLNFIEQNLSKYFDFRSTNEIFYISLL